MSRLEGSERTRSLGTGRSLQMEGRASSKGLRRDSTALWQPRQQRAADCYRWSAEVHSGGRGLGHFWQPSGGSAGEAKRQPWGQGATHPAAVVGNTGWASLQGLWVPMNLTGAGWALLIQGLQ